MTLREAGSFCSWPPCGEQLRSSTCCPQDAPCLATGPDQPRADSALEIAAMASWSPTFLQNLSCSSPGTRVALCDGLH